MPTYAFYPQGAALVVEEARFDTDDAALAHAEAVARAHPLAHEVSVWCADRYVGRLQAILAEPPPAAAPARAAAARKPRARASRAARRAPRGSSA